MNLLASIVLIGWIPIMMPIFGALPTRRAVIAAYVAAWLFLPNGGFSLPGLPNYTKMTATSFGILLAGAIFDPRPILTFRPRWTDAPMIAWCLTPFFTSVLNDLGVYDGFSGVVAAVVGYGLPYFAGRVYLRDALAIRDLAIGIVIGGLIYVPFCLWEIRMSPQLGAWVYGGGRFGNSIRYGGYRPVVFMTDGLEVGMWMASASLLGCWLWAGGTIRRIKDWPFYPILIGLVLTTILCKSTGSLMLLIAGLIALWTSKRMRTMLPVLLLASVAPLYCGVRTTGQWDGRGVVEFITNNLDADRAQSLEFRLDNEDILMKKALQRPAFGWGGWGRARVYDDQGKDISVTDGLWIIALGNNGIVGLTSVFAILTLPAFLLCLSVPARRWGEPEVAPAAALAVLLGLYAIDDVSNAMFNPVYYLAAGALMGPSAFVVGKRETGGGRSEELEGAWGRAEELDEGAKAGVGSWEEAERGWRDVLGVIGEGGDRSVREVARAEARRARCLAYLGRWGEAIEARGRVIELLEELVAGGAEEEEPGLADALNDLAWLLAMVVPAGEREASRAVELAGRAVRMGPERSTYHNTLGAALVRAGRWPEAVAALGRSVSLSRGVTTPFDLLLVSIARSGIGDLPSAREAFDAAVGGFREEIEGNPELVALRDEAANLLKSRDSDAGAATPGA